MCICQTRHEIFSKSQRRTISRKGRLGAFADKMFKVKNILELSELQYTTKKIHNNSENFQKKVLKFSKYGVILILSTFIPTSCWTCEILAFRTIFWQNYLEQKCLRIVQAAIYYQQTHKNSMSYFYMKFVQSPRKVRLAA